jgi:uncharacterized protein (TIGR02147 family)
MEKPFIYDCQSFGAILAVWLEWLKKTNPKFSLRWAAGRLGLKSHAHLVRLVEGDKHPSDELLHKLATLLDLTVDEFAFARTLADLDRTKRPDERAFIIEKLDTLRKSAPDVLLQLEAFAAIAHWHHLAIFEMITLPDFQCDPQWIAARLGHAITAAEVSESLVRLKKIGLVAISPSGQITRAVDQFTTTHNVASSAIRQFHGEMLLKAQRALHEIPVEKRLFFGHTMPLDSSKLEEAASLIIDFRRKFHKLLDGGNPDSVYHLAIQVIPLTVDHQSKNSGGA